GSDQESRGQDDQQFHSHCAPSKKGLETRGLTYFPPDRRQRQSPGLSSLHAVFSNSQRAHRFLQLPTPPPISYFIDSTRFEVAVGNIKSGVDGRLSFTKGPWDDTNNVRRYFVREGTRMPELPDIVVYIERLRPRIEGQVLERARLASPFLL